MPVVPEPPDEEMPRIDMLLVPLVSMFTPGVYLATSVKSFTPLRSSVSCENALTLTGTLLSSSLWRVAVMTISCSEPPASGAASADAAAGAAASAAAGGAGAASWARAACSSRPPPMSARNRACRVRPWVPPCRVPGRRVCVDFMF